jgi:S1-C subfamily serine protease
MRKLLCATAAAAVAGSVLTGCGASLKQPPVPRPLTDQQMIKAAGPGVVEIKTKGRYGSATGTGFLISSTEVYTPAHVLAGGVSFKVKFASGRIVPARIEGRNDCADKALLKLAQPVHNAVTLPLSASGRPDPNTHFDLLHYGSNIQSFGHETMSTVAMTVTNPHLGGRADVTPDMAPVTDLFQGSPGAPAGASGGPALDLAGNVLGMFVIRGDNDTQAYFEPASQLRGELASLRGGSQHGSLGMEVAGFYQVDLARYYGSRYFARLVTSVMRYYHQTGLFVLATEDGQPADRADIYPGDVITRVNGERVHTMRGVCSVLESSAPGARISVEGVTLDPHSSLFLKPWKVTVRTHR